jgi:hypothetical protein
VALLIVEYLDVGQPRRVVDRDVYVLPADDSADRSGGVGALPGVAPALARDAVARPVIDPPEFLDVDVDQLARSLTLIALRGLQAETAEFAHPDPRENPRDCRERHLEHLGDLGAGQPHTPQRRDRFDTPLVRAIGNQGRRGRAVQQAGVPLGAVAGNPLARSAVGDSRCLGSLHHRPPRHLHAINQQLATLDAQTSVSVQLHPVSSLELVA